MIGRLLPGGLRGQLVLAISAITVVVLAGTFVALHEGTGADIRGEIDRELRVQFAEFEQEVGPRVDTPAELQRAAQRYIVSQRYHPEALIFAIQVADGSEVTNQREIIEREVEREAGESGEGGEESPSLLNTPAGLSTVSGDETGQLRVLTQPVVRDGHEIGTFRAANPLTAVEEAQESLRNTFLLVGAVALLLAVAAAAWIAGRLTNPLRRIARFSSAVDAGDLARRLDVPAGSREARVLAESFNRMLDRLEGAFRRQRAFVADASHELRTPLTVLRGEIELLARGRGQAPTPGTADKLLREVERMNRLVEDMLTLAGAESGGLVDRRPIDLDEFFDDLRRDLPLMGPREYRVDGQVGTLDADPDRLAQVVRNLVRNAVAHTDPNERITVAAEAENSRIEFSVADTGTGIPAQHLDRLFDRFYRTDTARSRDAGGSGLGLAIARAIVEAHGGRIWAESQPGVGTVIRFQLPGYKAG